METVDVLVVGGGINGVSIARDAAGRGLRHLEQHDDSLVRKALIEREVLLKSAPHIMWPLRFILPHDVSQRPAWLIRCGLFLYDHLARSGRRPVRGETGLPGGTRVGTERRRYPVAPLQAGTAPAARCGGTRRCVAA